MQKHWLRKEGCENLLIYTLGWACTPNAVAHIKPDGYDILCICDYRETEKLVPAEFCSYKKITLVAWSFGVWVAEQIAGNLILDRAIAFNGTPFPTNEKFGINPRIIALTIKGLSSVGMDLFNEKTYGEKDRVPAGFFPNRSLEEKIEELRIICERSQKETQEIIKWDKAFISIKDSIFPPRSMKEYWRSRGLGTLIDTPHYPFADPEIIIRELA